ncbi:putative alpha-14 polygalactosaminidase [Anaeramoeba ignava]|uniref:Alpha-14 polygalactosaminidase n=1 Tax=Anaeramoeba ignava TaxID=1746090 RepID=A0A9Q0R7B3_ANAIG|nr:putative alpha-14 polygalactosaminidase [Anaeramoeba ignava]
MKYTILLIIFLLTLKSKETNGVAKGTSWLLQLDGEVRRDLTLEEAKFYDIDLFDTNSTTVAELKNEGRIVIAYMSCGSWENWRPDAGDFPTEAIGNKLSGWAGEKWLDTTNSEVRTIMTQRMDLAVSKGFDGIDCDNVDAGFASNPYQLTGFYLNSSTALDYLSFISQQANSRGLLRGLKNCASVSNTTQVRNWFDFAVVESCFVWDECDYFFGFLQDGKAVFDAEYLGQDIDLNECTFAQQNQMGLLFFPQDQDLDGQFWPCPTTSFASVFVFNFVLVCFLLFFNLF